VNQLKSLQLCEVLEYSSVSTNKLLSQNERLETCTFVQFFSCRMYMFNGLVARAPLSNIDCGNVVLVDIFEPCKKPVFHHAWIEDEDIQSERK
jgi:hypothetical protein